jgi:putative transcription antitermination factor YqgF
MAAGERYLGIDVGARRVGLALASAEAKQARPHSTIAPADVAAFIDREGPFAAIVVGLPRSLDGTATAQTLAVQRWVDDELGDRANLVWQDEFGTSSLAEEELQAAGKPYRREDIDARAAAVILQDYLDRL